MARRRAIATAKSEAPAEYPTWEATVLSGEEWWPCRVTGEEYVTEEKADRLALKYGVRVTEPGHYYHVVHIPVSTQGKDGPKTRGPGGFATVHEDRLDGECPH